MKHKIAVVYVFALSSCIFAGEVTLPNALELRKRLATTDFLGKFVQYTNVHEILGGKKISSRLVPTTLVAAQVSFIDVLKKVPKADHDKIAEINETLSLTQLLMVKAVLQDYPQEFQQLFNDGFIS